MTSNGQHALALKPSGQAAILTCTIALEAAVGPMLLGGRNGRIFARNVVPTASLLALWQ